MDDYISREAAIDAVDVGNLHRGIIDALQAIISDIPAADVRHVVRGRWEWNKHYGLYQCSNCHNSYVDIEWVKEGKWKYCPSCGADMREATADG